jgi:hypothetical protein
MKPIPTMPYGESTRACAKACQTVLFPDDAMYQWLQIYLDHTAGLEQENRALRANVSKSVLRRLKDQHAVAPEQNAALIGALEWWHSDYRHMQQKEPAWVPLARAAIAKAGG